MADRVSAPAGTSGSASPSMSLNVVKAVRTLACSLTRTNKEGEADGTCEGRTKEDIRALLVGLSTVWGDKSPTKGQLDAMVTHLLKHVNAQLMSAEQPQAGAAETAAGPPAEKSDPLYQWGTPSNVSEARAADRSTTAKLTSKKTCVTSALPDSRPAFSQPLSRSPAPAPWRQQRGLFVLLGVGGGAEAARLAGFAYCGGSPAQPLRRRRVRACERGCDPRRVLVAHRLRRTRNLCESCEAARGHVFFANPHTL